MYLKSLYLHGFKSFADKTTFEFDRGVTGIVGPNGCGKSNVVDAVRWVLGETSAKALRGGEMADVIFNGSEKRRALGMAEVTLTMADCEEALKTEHNEVAITRRVYRDGKSEYRINGTLCRLRDIGDLFMDTGIGRSSYSIMEQGKIDLLLSSKPEDRRSVFEEAAGITKSKKEKKEALRKLEYTEANLLRVSDVMEEQERRIGALKRQVAKARRYQALFNEVRILDTHLSHHKFTHLRAEREELAVSLRSREREKDVLELELPEREGKLAEVRARAEALEAELTRLRGDLAEKRNVVSTARNRISFNEERKAELEERIKRYGEEIAQAEARLGAEEESLAESRRALSELEGRILSQEEAVAAREAEMRGARTRREEVEKEGRMARTELNATQNLIASTQAKLESALSQVEGSRERAAELAGEAGRLQEELDRAGREREALERKLNAHLEQRAGLEAALAAAEGEFQRGREEMEAARQAVTEAHGEWTRRKSRWEALAQLADSGEGLRKGTQAVLKGLNDPALIKEGLRGVLGQQLKAPDEYAVAVEALLGEDLQTVLVRDEDLAGEILTRLTEGKKGTAALLPESFLPAKTAGETSRALPKGALAWAVEVVEVDDKLSGLLARLLAGALIVPDRATALRLRAEEMTGPLVTLDGELLEAEGIWRGGSGGSGGDSILRRRNEMDALREEVADLARSEEKARARVETLEGRTGELRGAVEAAREALQGHQVAESTMKGELGLAAKEAESLAGKMSSLAREREDLAARERKAGENRSGLDGDLARLRERLETLEGDARTLARALEEAQREEREAGERLAEGRTALAVERQARESATAQQKPMAGRIQELRELNARRAEELRAARERIEKGEAESVALRGEMAAAESTIAKLERGIAEREEGRAALRGKEQEAEQALRELRERVADLTARMGREEVEATKLDLRLESLREAVAERHQVELEHFRPDAHALLACIAEQRENAGRRRLPVEDGGGAEGEPDWAFVESVAGELKKRLDAMGPVNVDAIEEFEELEERHRFTREQHDDLVSSKAQLLEIIERINSEAERLFAETFKAVNANFGKMFKELFGPEAKASLHLQDEGDPLESGIEVIARPPGKKLQSITLMSGGERSMTAVALLFSIYMVKPSPFCVLDELDAPLDESNIGRFLKVLDAFIHQSQFIIVTHSKRTMQRADVMYGVTMEEFGVSKPVGMRLTAEEGKGEARTAA
ncbi:MAG: chromosome segregation protein SMC, partial [Verrucomicrobiales bacterium]